MAILRRAVLGRRGLGWLPASALLLCGCPSSTPTPTDPNGPLTGTFTVAPITVCSGETVALTWDVSSPAGDPAPFLNLVATSFNAEIPTAVQITTDGPSGTQYIHPTSSAALSFSAVSDPNAAYAGAFFASQAVTVLADATPTNLTLALNWGCQSGVGGGPGWETRAYDPGEFASTNVWLTQVRNVSGFPVTVKLQRGGANGGVLSATLDNNATTTVFNGGLFLAHTWSAEPSPTNLFAGRPQTCEAAAAAGAQPPSNIALQITLECGGS